MSERKRHRSRHVRTSVFTWSQRPVPERTGVLSGSALHRAVLIDQAARLGSPVAGRSHHRPQTTTLSWDFPAEGPDLRRTDSCNDIDATLRGLDATLTRQRGSAQAGGAHGSRFDCLKLEDCQHRDMSNQRPRTLCCSPRPASPSRRRKLSSFPGSSRRWVILFDFACSP